MSNEEAPGSTYGPTRAGYGSGVYRRRIRARSFDGAVHADMEDDFHRFSVHVEHGAGIVTGVRGAAGRYPWTTCPGALDVLPALVGLALTESHAAVRKHSDPRTHCTHLFDLATVAVTCAARRSPAVDYVIEIPDAGEGERVVRLERDGAGVLEWRLDGAGIAASTPAPWAGRSLRGGFGRWAEETLPPLEAEAAQLLRRAVFIAVGRQFDFHRLETGAVIGATAGSCHSFSAGVWEQAARAHGSVRDFTDGSAALLVETLEP